MSFSARPAHRLLAVAGLAAVAAWLAGGLAAAADRDLHARYAGLFADDSRTQAVLLVAIDPATLTAWGPLPWPAEREQQLADVIEAGAPRLIVGPEGQVALRPADGSPSTLAGEPDGDPDYIFAGENTDPEAADVARVATMGVDPLIGPALLREKNPSFPAAALRALGLPVRDGPLPAHYVSRLPTVPAHRVALGEIPAVTFRDRVVLIGRSDAAAATVNTPLGPMTPAQVEAHALLGALDGVAWTDAPAWLRLVATGLWALALALGLRGRGALGVAAIVTIAIGLVALIDLGLFAAGVVRLGVGTAGLVALAAGLAHVLIPAPGALGAGHALLGAGLRERSDGALAASAASGLHKVSDA
jgi:CHASE2 domain-containing sensor protein